MTPMDAPQPMHLIPMTPTLAPEQIPFPTGNQMLDDLLSRYFQAKERLKAAMASGQELLYADPEDPEVAAMLSQREANIAEAQQEVLELNRLIATIMSPEPFMSAVNTAMMTPGAEEIANLMRGTGVPPIMAPMTEPMEPGAASMSPAEAEAFFRAMMGAGQPKGALGVMNR